MPRDGDWYLLTMESSHSTRSGGICVSLGRIVAAAPMWSHLVGKPFTKKHLPKKHKLERLREPPDTTVQAEGR